VTHILQVWRDDGVPPGVPMFITESNIAWQSSEAFVDNFGALWLADYVGAFLTAGGDAVYYFHYLPLGVHPGCNESPGTFGMFTVDSNYVHRIFPAASDIRDAAGNVLVTVYAILLPDDRWSLLVVNKDQENQYAVRISFHDSEKNTDSSLSGPVEVTSFGRAQYQWHPNETGGSPDPDGPAKHATILATPATTYVLAQASITVIKGNIPARR
jgi:hypothetical protein